MTGEVFLAGAADTMPLCDIVSSLADESEEGASLYSSCIQRLWTCPLCHTQLAVTMVEQLQHQANCKKELEDVRNKSSLEQTGAGQDPAMLKDYHCVQCGETLKLTAIGILKHKRDHARRAADTS